MTSRPASGGQESSGSGDIDRTLELLWDTGPRPSRGPKPGLSVDRIVDAAIRIADEEGLDAVSMRRVATDLGTGAMSLYRYVPGKAELLDLMLDRVRFPDGPNT
ncbi:TetR/AcrR family transcriptional regulator [Streptomyces sp. L7]